MISPVETPFAHLHTHSTASDGAASPEALVEAAVALGQTTLALTDHRTLAGHPRFVAAARVHGITPILGAELHVHTPHGAGHMVVLAHNRESYEQLTRIVRIGLRERLTAGHLRGLIVTSACMGGVLARALARSDYWSARDAALYLRDLLGPTAFYLEIQPTFGVVLARLLALGRELGIRVILTNDVHQLAPQDETSMSSIGCTLLSATRLRTLSPLAGYGAAVEEAGRLAQAITDAFPISDVEGALAADLGGIGHSLVSP